MPPSVSYTHLDVYKRQGTGRSSCSTSRCRWAGIPSPGRRSPAGSSAYRRSPLLVADGLVLAEYRVAVALLVVHVVLALSLIHISPILNPVTARPPLSAFVVKFLSI